MRSSWVESVKGALGPLDSRPGKGNLSAFLDRRGAGTDCQALNLLRSWPLLLLLIDCNYALPFPSYIEGILTGLKVYPITSAPQTWFEPKTISKN